MNDTIPTDSSNAHAAAYARIRLATEGSPWELASAFFAALVLEERIAHLNSDRWAINAADVDPVLPFAVFTTGAPLGDDAAVLDLGAMFGCTCYAAIRVGRGTVAVRLAAGERIVLRDAHAWLRQAFPPATPTAASEVPITFWALGCGGAEATSRTIPVPEWRTIAANYPAGIRGEIEALMSDGFRPTAGGQLLLWYGPPGTGKTHALRALAWQWRAWCDLEYVVDPDLLLGDRADYLLEVLLEEPDDDRWRLLVLEDTGELLAADAKQRTGQGLSRLLNVVDGLVGQGLRVMVLVTTNEPLGRLHPAIARPGRCAVRIEFEPFPPAEADAWLVAHGLPAAGRSATLADLFGTSRGEEPARERVIGFS